MFGAVLAMLYPYAPNTWFPLLPWAELWYNTSFQTSAKMTPFEVVYGRPPPTISRFVIDGTTTQAITESFRQRDETLGILKANLLQAQTRMKALADKGRREISFEVGDWVYVRLRPYRQLSLRLQRYNKLSRRFFGSFQVIQKIGQVAYKLDLPLSSKIHPVFHVSVLRKCIGKPEHQVTPIDLIDQSSSLNLLPEEILQHRTITKGQHQLSQCLVKWVGLPVSDATWEDTSLLQRQFPSLNLEDKVPLQGVGNVVNQGIGPAALDIGLKRSSRRVNSPKYFKDFVVPKANG